MITPQPKTPEKPEAEKPKTSDELIREMIDERIKFQENRALRFLMER